MCPNTVGLSGMVIGTTAGWNSASNRLMADGQPNEDQWQSMGVYCLGAAFGGLTHGHLARFFGYRLTVGLCDLFASIGWLMFAFIDSLEFERQERLAIGRFVQGLAAGGLGILMPTYITHIANVELRGMCVCACACRRSSFSHVYYVGRTLLFRQRFKTVV